MNDATSTLIALCASAITTGKDAGAPEWVHLLPATSGGTIQTNDKRGPYTVADAAKVIERSMVAGDGRLPLDENHATDLAAPNGQPAPARGWIVELEARADGIWGRVEWSDAGRALIETRAYRVISPVIVHDKAKRVWAILRASLVNRPNLRGLAALHQETDMTFQQKLAEMLGLGADASEDDIAAALAKALEKPEGGEGGEEAALNAALAPVAKALKLDEGADLKTVLNAIQATPNEGELVELQSTVTELTTQLNAVTESTARDKATAYVDGEIKRGRAGLKPVRDRYIALHMKDPAEAEALIGAMVVLNASGTAELPPAEDGAVSLNAAQKAVAAQLGMTNEDYAAELAADTKETV